MYLQLLIYESKNFQLLQNLSQHFPLGYLSPPTSKGLPRSLCAHCGCPIRVHKNTHIFRVYTFFYGEHTIFIWIPKIQPQKLSHQSRLLAYSILLLDLPVILMDIQNTLHYTHFKKCIILSYEYSFHIFPYNFTLLSHNFKTENYKEVEISFILHIIYTCAKAVKVIIKVAQARKLFYLIHFNKMFH